MDAKLNAALESLRQAIRKSPPHPQRKEPETPDYDQARAEAVRARVEALRRRCYEIGRELGCADMVHKLSGTRLSWTEIETILVKASRMDRDRARRYLGGCLKRGRR